MRAQKLGFFTAILLLISSIFITNLHVTDANASSSSNLSINTKQFVNASYPAKQNAAKVIVAMRPVTTNDVENMKSKIGVYVKGQDYNQLVGNHGTGLRPPTSEEWETISQNAYVASSVSAPSSPSEVDNSILPWFPPIGNQGAEGSCVAWSVGYYTKTFQEAKEHGWDLSGASWTGQPAQSYQDEIISPEFIYHLINSGVDNGASFNDAMDLVCYIGACSWAKMPYNPSDHSSWPSEEAWNEAPYYRGDNNGYQYMSVDSSSELVSLKNWLASQHLVTIGVDADKFSNLTSSDLWTLDNYASPDVNHANTIVGYDDNINYTEAGQTRYGAFKVANSWGVGFSGEKIPDGFYWISYETMKQRIQYCTFYDDLIGYQPELTATFTINHVKRGECQIEVGLGTPTSPITTKSFSRYISGGNYPFCPNSIILDVTEFKSYMLNSYNQSYFLAVRDGGSSTLGTITEFKVGEIASPDAPRPTVQITYVYLTASSTLITPEISVSPTSGPPGGALTLSGQGFTPSGSASLSYLNSTTSTWVSIDSNATITSSGQLTYLLEAPDLMVTNPAGDNPSFSDAITFRAEDNSNGFSCTTPIPYVEWRRGLTSVGDVNAAGLYGGDTNLESTVSVKSGQSVIVAGKWFNPGDVTLFWDGITIVGAATVDQTGAFDVTITVPTTSGGPHNIAITDENVAFTVTVTRLPSTANDYNGLWHTSNFTVNLTPDPSNAETRYRINGGAAQTVNSSGQPLITTEGENNTLEYWSVDVFGNEESPHNTLTQIKLDATAPTGSVQINNGAVYTNSTTVTLALTSNDALSGVYQVRFSNDGVWDTESWEIPSPTNNWTLTLGDGEKTVFYQVKDIAGLVSTCNASIILDATCPVVNAGNAQTVSAGSIVTLNASSCTDNVGIVNYTWDFGDGTTGTGITATHTYENAQTYTATLTVQDAAGNSASSNVAITVQISAVPEFPSAYILLLAMILVLSVAIFKKKAVFARERKPV
jgi:C1A family cysteine protease